MSERTLIIFSKGFIEEAIKELRSIAEQIDGVRFQKIIRDLGTANMLLTMEITNEQKTKPK